MSAAIDLVLKRPEAKVLCLYPSRALIVDQHQRWSQLPFPELKVGIIDGGVPQDRRSGILGDSNVILMTPDVAHAWLMRRCGNRDIQSFLHNLDLLILDEAHVYDGAFGTNMAYFLRRLEVVAQRRMQVIVSTATLGDPESFMKALVGHEAICFSSSEDGSDSPGQTVFLLQGGELGNTVKFLKGVSRYSNGPFLAFADSRRQVERIVAMAARKENSDSGNSSDLDDDAADDPNLDDPPNNNQDITGILPYRSGYEESDRRSIQRALAQGRLAGVVSTSALELGIDIGDINLTILLNTPPSVKSFNQRMGRGGRKAPGVCVVIDTSKTIAATGLNEFIAKPVENNWFYMQNRYLQYINALCAAHEFRQIGFNVKQVSVSAFPEGFEDFLENELDPQRPIPDDLFRLKQLAGTDPQLEFPIRTGMEKQFKVTRQHFGGDASLGTLTYSQVMREAYPGAIYYYMGRPYRVRQFRFRDEEIKTRREKFWMTGPINQVRVFPSFEGGMKALWKTPDDTGFVAEAQLQVSERVLGFREWRGGANPVSHMYQVGSPYYENPLQNFFESTGVCWWFDGLSVESQSIGDLLVDAFCSEFGISEGDVGVGVFTSRVSPLHSDRTDGICIYDTTAGSLRLTQALAENFETVFKAATRLAEFRGITDVENAFQKLSRLVSELVEVKLTNGGPPDAASDPHKDDIITVVEPGQMVMVLAQAPREGKVLGYRYTPNGVVYDIENPGLDTYIVQANRVQPMLGETMMIRVNLLTGEERPLGAWNGLD